jgi:hypothetical protein
MLLDVHNGKVDLEFGCFWLVPAESIIMKKKEEMEEEGGGKEGKRNREKKGETEK